MSEFVEFLETSKSARIRMNQRKHGGVGEKNQPDEGLVFGVGGGVETRAKPCYINALESVLTAAEKLQKALVSPLSYQEFTGLI